MDQAELQKRAQRAEMVLSEVKGRLATARARLPIVTRQLADAGEAERPALAAEYVALQAVLEVLPGDIGQAAREHARARLETMAARWHEIRAAAPSQSDQLKELTSEQRAAQRELAGIGERMMPAEARAVAEAPVKERAREISHDAAPLHAELGKLQQELQLLEAQAARMLAGERIDLGNPRTWERALDGLARAADQNARQRATTLRARP